MAAKPVRFYRLWCGRRRWSRWLPTRLEAFMAGVPHGVTYVDAGGGRGGVSLGPLAWIEVGERRYAKSKTVSLGRG